jgi:hypothetical protein
MIDDKGSFWYETEYEGYGVFAGKDFYELVAEMNGGGDRGDGIDLFFGTVPFKSPNLNESSVAKWENIAPESCPDQGYFYDDEEDEIQGYASSMDAERDGFSNPNINRCCRGKQMSHAGFKWKYKV